MGQNSIFQDKAMWYCIVELQLKIIMKVTISKKTNWNQDCQEFHLQRKDGQRSYNSEYCTLKLQFKPLTQHCCDTALYSNIRR